MRAGLAAAVVAALVSLVVASSAGAYGFLPNSNPPDIANDGFTGAVFRVGPNGTIGEQTPDNYADNAGEHPDTGVVKFGLVTDSTPNEGEPVGKTQSLRVDIPAGLVPDPTAFPKCTNDQIEVNACPRGSQVGTQELRIRGTVSVGGLVNSRQTIDVVLPIYNMELENSSQLARFSFAPRTAPNSFLLGANPDDGGQAVNLDRVDILGGVRDTGDFGLFFTIKAPRNPTLVNAKQTFWGVPGAARFDQATTDTDPGAGVNTVYGRDQRCTFTAIPLVGNSCAAAGDVTTSVVPNRPFLTNPTACLGILRASIEAFSYAGERASSFFDTPRGAQQCPNVPFNPSGSFAPKDPPRDSPTAFNVHLDVPQSTSGDVLGTSHVRTLSTTLPRGVTINPSAGNTVQACTDDQFGAGTRNTITCPAASRVGSVSIKSPQLPEPLVGSAYVGQPLPGNRYRLFINGDRRGATVRLKGTISPDATTGQVTAVFDGLPQLPFSSADISLDGGATGVLASTADCGPADGLVGFGPWSGTATVNAVSTVQSIGCDGVQFAPSFSGAAGTPKSGAYSTAVARIGRPDGQQNLQGVKVDLPPGLLANTKGAPRCSNAAAATGSCPANTRVGTAGVRSGAGSSPLALNGPVYFGQPYKGAPFSFITVIRAIAGPYDLGNVVVRQAVRLDPKDAHVTVESDPLPQVVGGIPLRLRDLVFNVNKGKFVLNPTYCGGGIMRGLFTSTPGLRYPGAQRLAFSGCGALKFKPRLALSLSGGKSTLKDGGHPGVLAKLRGSGTHGQANFKRVAVSLPTSLALDPGNAETLCEYAEALKTDPNCPKGSIVGRATATTGILDKRLTGKVFFAKRIRTNKFGRQIATLPMLVVPLRGQGVKVNLIGTTAVSRNRLVTTFNTPDAPVSKFDLRIVGGKNGILVSNTSVCKKSRRVRVAMRAQSKKLVRSNKNLSIAGCKATKKKSKKR